MGRAKEAAGSALGREDLHREGKLQQVQADAEREAAERAAEAEKREREAEKPRPRLSGARSKSRPPRSRPRSRQSAGLRRSGVRPSSRLRPRALQPSTSARRRKPAPFDLALGALGGSDSSAAHLLDRVEAGARRVTGIVFADEELEEQGREALLAAKERERAGRGRAAQSREAAPRTQGPGGEDGRGA